MHIVICITCKLRYGKYWTFHDHPECVERERKRHNCRLIHQCKEWMAVQEQWFYTNPKCRGEDDGPPAGFVPRGGLVDYEEQVTEAKAVFRVRLNAYEDAEARACSREFAAALADRTVRDARVRADADADAAASAALRAAVGRASEARRAADRALQTVRVRGAALARAMDELKTHAVRSGFRLPLLSSPVDPDGDGRIVFIDRHDPYYHVYDVHDEELDVDHGGEDACGLREP